MGFVRNNANAMDMEALRNFASAVNGQQFMLIGESNFGDRSARNYFYNESSSATADGDNIIDAPGMDGIGRYIKQQFEVNWSEINSKPSFFSGSYADLTGKPALSNVATSGSYNDLTDKPTIGSGTVTSVGITGSDFSISGSPVTANGNISMALSNTGISAGTYGAVTVDAKGRVTAGKRQEVYNGTTGTGGSVGVYTVTYGTAYASAPNVQPSFVSTNPRESIRLTASSTTGFTVIVELRTDVIGLLPSYAGIGSRAVSILVTEQ